MILSWKKKLLLIMLATYVVLLVLSSVWRWTGMGPWVYKTYDSAVYHFTGHEASPEPFLQEGTQKVTLQVKKYNDDEAVSDEPEVALAYEEWTPDDPEKAQRVVLLLHGSPGVKENFEYLGPILGKEFRTIAIDLPGFGDSEVLVPSYSNRAHARYVFELMDQLGIKEADVLGFSMGSGVALRMVEQQPQRVNSLIFYGGIGIQEGEGSGDYYFEHMKYAVGYIAVTAIMELTPHFGWLDGLEMLRRSMVNFYDTDQRPLRNILEGLNESKIPLLILQGRDDFLVYDHVAEEHHQIVEHSRLVMYDASHFMLFEKETTQDLADEIIPFLENPNDPEAIKFLDHTADRVETAPTLPVDLDLKRWVNPWAKIGVIILSSYILEDPTTIAVGLLIKDGQLDLFVGVLAIFIGIFTGDLGLYLLGFIFGRRLMKWKFLRNQLPTDRMDQLGLWFDRHGWTAVLASRFIPGTRLPLYVSAGMLGNKPGRFALWTALAVMIWAPTMVVIVLLLGDAASSPFKAVFGDSWVTPIAAIILLLFLLRTVPLLFTPIGRARLIARYTKWRRWEFWPMWIFYAPLAPKFVYLWFKHGGAHSITVVNPCMMLSGFAGESKIDILRAMPEEWVIPFDVVEQGELTHRIQWFKDIVEAKGWDYPLILKPNEGQRGVGVKMARSLEDAMSYLENVTQPVIVQTYHPGPYEAGVFYYRMPNEEKGHIFSITDKKFPVLEGDGKHTITQLIWRHPRYRMQAEKFLKRYANREDEILKKGEKLKLAMAGNHAQGTMFLEGKHLITPELEARIDEISQPIEGFYFGRYDLRYTDVEKFMAGEDLGIVELNGVTAESTNIYDPERTLAMAYQTLGKQWEIAFKIGKMNRAMGHKGGSLLTLIKTIRAHFKEQTGDTVAD